MEPSLRQGDVILVRKSDVYPHAMWKRWTSASSSPSPSSKTSSTSSSLAASSAGTATDKPSQQHHEDALKVLAYDTASGRPIGEPWTSRTYLKPPTIYEPGCVVVYRAVDAQKYPMGEYRVRRVIGLGGQICRVSTTTTTADGGGGQKDLGTGGGGYEENDVGDDNNNWQTPRRWADRIVRVPPFALWVEGDADYETNIIGDDDLEKTFSSTSKSDKRRIQTWTDSRVHGAVCKNNVIGLAERIVWPPSRWGKIPLQPCDTSTTSSSRLPRAWWL